MSEERWKPVVGYEGVYEVSDQGRVRFIGQLNPTRYTPPYIRKQSLNASGAPSVTLYKNREIVTRRVARLVYEAFIGPLGTKQLVYKDGQCANCRLENLAVTEPAKLRRTLTEAEVREIRAAAKHRRQVDIAREYGLDRHYVSRIVSGRAWKRVKPNT